MTEQDKKMNHPPQSNRKTAENQRQREDFEAKKKTTLKGAEREVTLKGTVVRLQADSPMLTGKQKAAAPSPELTTP